MERIGATTISVLLSMIGVHCVALSDDPRSPVRGPVLTRDGLSAPVTLPTLNMSSFNHIDTAGSFSIICLGHRECQGDSMLFLATNEHGEDADPVRLQRVFSQVAAVEPTAPVVVSLKDKEIQPGIFAELTSQIAALAISRCNSSRTTGKLQILNLTNLLGFSLDECQSPVTILKSDFENNCRLRGIIFSNTPFLTLEQGTFTDLPELRYLNVEYSLSLRTSGCLEPEMRPLVMTLHCSCGYRWLRVLLNNNSALTSTVDLDKRIGIPNFMGPGPSFRPIDCAKPDYCSNISSQVQYTINDPCV